MTQFLLNMSIRRKQILIMTLTSSAALVLACAAFIAYDARTFHRELGERVTMLADAVGNNCAAAIDFNDPKVAGEILAALRTDGNIVAACIYSHEGRVFATYQRDDSAFAPPVMQSASLEFTHRDLHLFREITQHGVTTGTIFVDSDLKGLSSRLMSYGLIVAAVFLTSLILAVGLSSQLQRLVSDPILDLARVARSVAVEKNFAVRATKRSGDELGQLVDGFNEMLAQIQTRDTALAMARDTLEKRVEDRTRELESTHKQLLEASRLGGMAEIATNVLHNVGNVLNSVNISATLVIDSVNRSKISGLAKAVAMMREHESDLGAFLSTDPRGKQLPAYLAQLSGLLLAEQAAAVRELVSLRANIDHIKEIVEMQQSYARVSGVREMVDIASLVEDSLRINEVALNRHGIEIRREFDAVPIMNVEKHKILQILVNLIRNAKHSCDDSKRDDKRITLRITLSDGIVRISVADNGVGIPPENLTRIFNHGFTTRKDGHGFGLHSGALAARELGGTLTALSDGSDRGATFTLELPCPTKENPNA